MNRGTAAPIHICFYSNRCEWSKAFIEEISKTNYHKEFRFICVDPSPNRPQLPSWLKSVPTLVISGEPEPRTNSEVMNWLYEKKMMDGGARQGGGGGRGAGGGGGGGGGGEPPGPEPYMDMEMGGGFGDSYSFIGDDTTAQGDGGLRAAHNFTYLNGQDSVGTREASNFQTTSNDQRRSKKEQIFDQQYEQMMKARDAGMPRPVMRQ
jgi:hypothetical protein